MLYTTTITLILMRTLAIRMMLCIVILILILKILSLIPTCRVKPSVKRIKVIENRQLVPPSHPQVSDTEWAHVEKRNKHKPALVANREPSARDNALLAIEILKRNLVKDL